MIALWSGRHLRANGGGGRLIARGAITRPQERDRQTQPAGSRKAPQQLLDRMDNGWLPAKASNAARRSSTGNSGP